MEKLLCLTILLLSVELKSVIGDIQCGASNTKTSNLGNCDSQSETRIANGRCAQPGQFPWMVYIQLIVSGKVFAACGGAILDPYTIMTAAHCTFVCQKRQSPNSPIGFPIDEYIVSIGERNIKDPRDGQIYYSSENVIVHPSYKYCSQKNSNDIALIKIGGDGMKVPYFTNNGLGSTNTICKPPSGRNYTGQTATIAGWGRVSSSNQTTANILQFAKVNVISNSECQKTFKPPLDDSQICASGSNGESSCNGDSGSALFIGDTQAVAIGVTSFGVKDCPKGEPVVYTRVSKYLGFINRNLGP